MKKYKIAKASVQTTTSLVEYEKFLDAEQLRAVMAGDGPKLVIAGAGSGKTRTVTYRVAKLVESGVPPQAIMLLTFTNKASREMLGRVEALLPNRAAGIWGGTFHHIGNRILRRFGEQAGISNDYTILDTADTRDVMKIARAEVALPKDKKFPKADTIRNILSLAVNMQTPLEKIIKEREPRLLDFTEYIIAVSRQYTIRKLEMNCIDFDDMLVYWRALLLQKHEAADMIRAQFRHILVDEYQDTNRLQGDIIDAMALERKNLTVVGDDSQSIYSFRGADFKNIIEFPRRYENAEVFYLTTNYRSTPQILNLANESIKHNRKQFQKELKAVVKPGPLPALVPARDVYEQAAFIAEHVLKLSEDGVPLKDIGALYRSHADSIEIQVELTRRRIPYIVRSGVRFFETAHIKDVISFLRFLYNPSDELSFSRAVQLFPGIGTSAAARLWGAVRGREDSVAAIARPDGLPVPPRARTGFKQFSDLFAKIVSNESQSPESLISLILENFYEEYLPAKFNDHNSRKLDIEQLAAFAAHFKSSGDFLSELALLQTIASEEMSAERTAVDEFLVLSSIHQAKGLEWRFVFLVGCADGRLPLERSLWADDGEEEERRLFYVAVTRAKEELYLCYPMTRTEKQGFNVILRRSRFIEEIPSIDLVTEQWQLETADETGQLDFLPQSDDADTPHLLELPVIDLDAPNDNADENSKPQQVNDDDDIPF